MDCDLFIKLNVSKAALATADSGGLDSNASIRSERAGDVAVKTASNGTDDSSQEYNYEFHATSDHVSTTVANISKPAEITDSRISTADSASAPLDPILDDIFTPERALQPPDLSRDVALDYSQQAAAADGQQTPKSGSLKASLLEDLVHCARLQSEFSVLIPSSEHIILL